MSEKTIRPVSWGENGTVRILDQTRLPLETVYKECAQVGDVWEAIKSLRVRGAPAIGVAAAFGIALVASRSNAQSTDALLDELDRAADYLASSRPTAVNLFWALDRMRARAAELAQKPIEEMKRGLTEEAQAILDEDDQLCRAIGEHGAALIQSGEAVLTHCNAGGLATSGYGTALAVMFTAHSQGKRLEVYANETRPLLQGSRLTTWELMRANIPVTLICDSMAAHLMQSGKVQRVVTGADRIAANGDAANKIGTYGLAVLAKAHDIPFHVAAPTTTIDLSTPTGGDIPIEERAAEEVTEGFGRRTAPPGVQVYSPAFDVTPAELIASIITEKGEHKAPYGPALKEAVQS